MQQFLIVLDHSLQHFQLHFVSIISTLRIPFIQFISSANFFIHICLHFLHLFDVCLLQLLNCVSPLFSEGGSLILQFLIKLIDGCIFGY